MKSAKHIGRDSESVISRITRSSGPEMRRMANLALVVDFPLRHSVVCPELHAVYVALCQYSESPDCGPFHKVV